MRRKPSVLLISISVHAVVLGLLATAPWWSPIANWPMPREVLAFTESPHLASLHDIEPPRGVRVVAYQGDMRAFAPQAQLAAVSSHWGAYYTRVARAAIDGSWRPEPVWEGLREGMVALDAIDPTLEPKRRLYRYASSGGRCEGRRSATYTPKRGAAQILPQGEWMDRLRHPMERSGPSARRTKAIAPP